MNWVHIFGVFLKLKCNKTQEICGKIDGSFDPDRYENLLDDLNPYQSDPGLGKKDLDPIPIQEFRITIRIDDFGSRSSTTLFGRYHKYLSKCFHN